LLKSEANLRAMLDNSPYLTWLKDAEGRVNITVNQGVCRLPPAGGCTAAMIGKDRSGFAHPKPLADKYPGR